MNDLLQQFQHHLKTEFPFLKPSNSKLLLAVSGGVDSVVLTGLFAKSGFDFVIAHCNFKLRGKESERDEAFVKTLGGKYNKEVLVKRFETEIYARQHKISIQEAARKLRYDWFEDIVKSEKLKVKSEKLSVQPVTSNRQPATGNLKLETASTFYIITAHHANDNIETLLINFFRGTGIHGLHGIPTIQGNILRPLLFAKREEILSYAKGNALEWVEDSSNASDKYTRNFIRLQMLPQAKEIFTNAEDNLLQNIERFNEAEILYNEAIALHKKKLLEQKGNEWHIPVLKLQQTAPLQTIVWEIIKEFGFSSHQTTEVIKLLQAANGSYVASATNRIIKNRNWIIIAPLQTETAQHILIEEGDKKVIFENGALALSTAHVSHFTLHDAPSVASLDASQIQFPLLLRKWNQGDYFYPLGMQKKKKLGKFFIDQKLSKTEKENVWVLEMDKKIIWVIGLRIDDRFKITASSKNILQIGLVKSF